jgi:hypothetical protein
VAIPFYERSNEAVAVLERNESLVLGGGSGSFSVAKTPQDPIAENFDQGAAPWIDQQHRVDLTTQSPHQGIMNRHRKCVCMWRYDSSITLFDVNPIQFMGNRNQVLLWDIYWMLVLQRDFTRTAPVLPSGVYDEIDRLHGYAFDDN